MKLPILSPRQFDPEKIAYKFTQSVKIKPVIHTDDRFEDVLQSIETFEEVQNFVRLNVNPEELQRFHEYREKRLKCIRKNILITSYMTEPSKVIRTKESDTQNQNELDKLWTSISNTLMDIPEGSSTQKNTGFQTPQGQIVSAKETTENLETSSQDAEVIPAFPIAEIILKVTDIPPLDVLYSPLRKAVARKHRKRRRIETPPGNEIMEVVWKDTPSNPIDNLTRLSQFAGAYTTATMDKAAKV